MFRPLSSEGLSVCNNRSKGGETSFKKTGEQWQWLKGPDVVLIALKKSNIDWFWNAWRKSSCERSLYNYSASDHRIQAAKQLKIIIEFKKEAGSFHFLLNKTSHTGETFQSRFNIQEVTIAF